MRVEAQRIAIAEYIGWVWLSSPDGIKDANGEWRRPDGHRVWVIPLFTTDLNAMHEAEKVLLTRQEAAGKDTSSHDYGCYSRYIGILRRAHSSRYGGAICALASQRAEAFLEAVGKWDGTK